MKVALTHAAGRLAGLEAALEARGIEVLRVPLVRTEALERAALAPLLECRWWLFTSASAVEALVALGVRFEGRRIGAVGEATARALRDAGGTVELVSHDGNASSLARDFLEYVSGDAVIAPVGIPQGDRALNTLQTELEHQGLSVHAVTVYRTISRPWPSGIGQPDVIVLASPSAVDALPDAVARAARLIALGPTTASTLHACNLECLTAKEPTVHGVLDALDSLRWDQASRREASLAPTKNTVL